MITSKDLDVEIGIYLLQKLIFEDLSRVYTGILMHFIALEYITNGTY